MAKELRYCLWYKKQHLVVGVQVSIVQRMDKVPSLVPERTVLRYLLCVI